MTYLKPSTPDQKESELSLKEIVDFLKTKQVETIIVWDLSCSIITRPNFVELNSTKDGQREVRRSRRGMLATLDKKKKKL